MKIKKNLSTEDDESLLEAQKINLDKRFRELNGKDPTNPEIPLIINKLQRVVLKLDIIHNERLD